MALNAFWGSKKVFVVNETGCQLAKEIVKELREANFNAAEEVSSFDYARFCIREAGVYSGGRGGQRVLCYPVQGRGLCGRPSGSPHQTQL